MSKLINRIPNFLYKPAAINLNLLPNIQSELLLYFEKMNQLTGNQNKQLYYFRTRDGSDLVLNFSRDCPVLCSELDRLKILDLVLDLVFIQIISSEKKVMPIHRDYKFDEETIFGHFGLNIPVCDCADSYTVFYDATVDNNQVWPSYGVGTSHVNAAPLPDKDTVQEIDRVESNSPLWVNGWVWHRAEVPEKSNRKLISIRFKDMQHLFDNGYFDDHLVAK